MEMHMIFEPTVKKKIFHKIFVIQHVISDLDTYLFTNHFMRSTTIFETF